MKYTLHIAFSELVGDLLLQVCEYAKKYGNYSADYINPIRFDFSDTNVIEVKKLGKSCLIKDFILFAMESFSGIPVKWITNDTIHTLQDGDDIEEFFEREFSDKIFEDDYIDPEMHLMFYVPLYEFGIYKHVKYIIENLPSGHKFVVNVIGITYDIAWACRMLDEEIENPFEWTIKFRYKNQKEGTASVWWRVPKDKKTQQFPQQLGVAPANLHILYPETKEF